MIRKKTSLDNSRYLITPSLLNSWQYMWDCVENVKETENDTISLEDKKDDAIKKAYEDFVRTLNREPTEPNMYMKEGIAFEEECYKGNTCISPIIDGGAYQIVGTKKATINNMNFLLYGRLDVLKGGIIYDIKRIWRYETQKYITSHQHPFYLELFKNTKGFKYLAFDGRNLHIETYWRDEVEDIYKVISDFIDWLDNNNLLEIYKEKWKARGE